MDKMRPVNLVAAGDLLIQVSVPALQDGAGMDHLEYEYADHVLLIQPSEFEKEIIRGVFGREPPARPVLEIEYKLSKRTGCNPIILRALAEIKEGCRSLRGRPRPANT